MKKRIVFEVTVGLLMLFSALYTYIPEAQYLYVWRYEKAGVGSREIFTPS